MKKIEKSVFICEKMPAPTEALEVDAARKIALLFSLILILFSCIKLEENDKKYSARKLQKMLEGTWELTDYQIDGVSYLDTFLKVNPTGNCPSYTFTQWKNMGGKTSSDYFDTGWFEGNCTPNSFFGWGYSFSPKEKIIHVGGLFFIDSIFTDSSPSFNVLKLEDNILVLEGNNSQHKRIINFQK
jgi:hypothetical protein